MAKRFYFCSILGTGTEADQSRSWFQQAGIQMTILDMRVYQEVEDGFMVAWGEIPDADHVLAVADPSVTYLPFENASGVHQPLTATLNNVSAANRTAIQAAFTAHGVPTTGIALTWTIGQVLQLMRRRIMIGMLLQTVDFDEPTKLISAMPQIRRKAMQRRLTNAGFDTSGITLTMTQAEAIVYLASQPVVDQFIAAHPGLAL